MLKTIDFGPFIHYLRIKILQSLTKYSLEAWEVLLKPKQLLTTHVSKMISQGIFVEYDIRNVFLNKDIYIFFKSETLKKNLDACSKSFFILKKIH